MKRLLLGFLVILFICIFGATGAFGYGIAVDGNGNAHKWDPGADSASTFNPASPPGTPGGATWSIMAPGHLAPTLAGDTYHPAGATSFPFVGMTGLGNVDAMGDPDPTGIPIEIWAVEWALDQWAAVSGFTNLGQVDDGDMGTANNGGFFDVPGWNGNGAIDANFGDLGDIRIAAYDFVGAILADTRQPATETDDGVGFNIGGDAHFAETNEEGFSWVNDPNHDLDTTPNSYDFATVVLHEMGHALNLTHRSEDPAFRPADGGVVMDMYTQRRTAMRDLALDDIAGVQAIYGPADIPDVPEPTTLLLVGAGLAGMVAFRRKLGN